MAGDDEACETASVAIKTMIQQLQTMWPRKKGNGWKITKVHETFHVPLDIHRNGAPCNYHTGPQEHNHIPIKNAAKKTQMNRHKIDLQTGERIVDRLILQRAFDRVNETAWHLDQELVHNERLGADTDGIYEPVNKEGVVKNASKGHVIMCEQSQVEQQGNKRQKRLPKAKGSVRWNTTKNGTIEKPILYQAHVLEFLCDKFFEDYAEIVHDDNGSPKQMFKMRCFTEYQRNGFVYRCHPHYRKERMYYDWCQVHWANDTEGTDEYIARIYLFIETPEGEIKAVVQSVDPKSTIEHGVFATYWHLEETGPLNKRVPKFELVDVDALGDHVMVIPYNLGTKRYIHIHDRPIWADCFLSNKPKEGEEEEDEEEDEEDDESDDEEEEDSD